MKKLLFLLCLSSFLVSCKKDAINVELPLDDVKIVQSPLSEFESVESEYFSYTINSTLHKDEYYYSFVINKPTHELNNIRILIVDSDNRGFISFFGYDKNYSLVLGEKKESDTRVIGVNINFRYSFEAKTFKLYSYFDLDNHKKEVKYKLDTNFKE